MVLFVAFVVVLFEALSGDRARLDKERNVCFIMPFTGLLDVLETLRTLGTNSFAESTGLANTRPAMGFSYKPSVLPADRSKASWPLTLFCSC